MTPRTTTRRRSSLIRVSILAIAALLSAAAVVSLVHEDGSDSVPIDQSAARTGANSASPEPTEPTGPAEPTEPARLGAGQLPALLPKVGAYARATVRPNGYVDVVEWVRTAQPVTTVTLGLPASWPADGVAGDVEVSSVDGPATGPFEVTGTDEYVVDKPATLFQARYTLSGVTEISPTSDTRALVLPVVLTLNADGVLGEPVDGPRRITVTTGTVLALACALSDDASELAPCGAPDADGDGWLLELGRNNWSELVAAQVDLR